jgi:hypothetical protein
MQPDGTIHPYHALAAVMRAIPKDSIITIDGGEAGQWAAMNAEISSPHLVIGATGYLGFLGNGWGYSLGAAIADPSRWIVNIHGDGSAGFHIQELDTHARFGLKILTIVVNNSIWGMSVNGQDLLYEGVTELRPAVKLSSKCRYEVVAQGFGCEGVKVDQFEDVEKGVKGLVESGGPGLMNLVVSVKPTTPATLSMVGATKDPNVSALFTPILICTVKGGTDIWLTDSRSLSCRTTTMSLGHITKTARHNRTEMHDALSRRKPYKTTDCATIPHQSHCIDARQSRVKPIPPHFI